MAKLLQCKLDGRPSFYFYYIIIFHDQCHGNSSSLLPKFPFKILNIYLLILPVLSKYFANESNSIFKAFNLVQVANNLKGEKKSSWTTSRHSQSDSAYLSLAFRLLRVHGFSKILTSPASSNCWSSHHAASLTQNFTSSTNRTALSNR